ncbi:MAG: PLP-dependent transferase [Candidatus Marinimicrobia bacterium]|nr:PLP-dependent transferase [Candidatus Neomarinimicrobiota bacterium]
MRIKLDMSISDGLIRLSIGIEDQSKLKKDLLRVM